MAIIQIILGVYFLHTAQKGEGGFANKFILTTSVIYFTFSSFSVLSQINKQSGRTGTTNLKTWLNTLTTIILLQRNSILTCNAIKPMPRDTSSWFVISE
jgi:hypothetical protein